MLVIAGVTDALAGDWPAAERTLRQAAAIDPGALEANGLLGGLYASQHRLPEAVAEFEKLAQRQPGSATVMTMVGSLLHKQNRTEQAQAWYERALAVDPQAAMAANNLAYLYAERGADLDVALGLAQTAKSRLPDDSAVNDTLGWVYHKRGIRELAITTLQESVKRDPSRALYHYHLGMAYAGIGDIQHARASLMQSLALDPQFENADDVRRTLSAFQKE